jgi:NitT/TauT family transport system substrate-binding protein
MRLPASRVLMVGLLLTLVAPLGALPGAGAPPPVASAAPPAVADAAPGAAGVLEAPDTGAAAQLVRVGGAVTESIGNSGLYIAMEKGYFVEQGLDVDLGRYPATDAYRPALATGELDFGTIDVNAGLFNIMARGIDIRFVADRGSTPPGQGWIGWMLRSDLADQIRDYADLRGRRIAHSFDGSYQHVIIGRSLQRGGLTERDVDLTIVPITEVNAALANRIIDATVGIEPFNTIAINNGWAVRWHGGDVLTPNGQVVVIVFSASFAGRRDVAQRWMAAYLKGVRDYNNALIRGPIRGEIIDILTRQTPLKDAAAWEQEPRATAPSGVIWPAIHPDGRMNVQSIQEDLDWWTRQGLVQGTVDLGRYIDHSFADAAAAQLGPHRP